MSTESDEILRGISLLEIEMQARFKEVRARFKQINEKLDRVLVLAHQIERDVGTTEPKKT